MPAGPGRRPIAAVADLFLTSPPETLGVALDPPDEEAGPVSYDPPPKRRNTVPVSLVLASALSDDAGAAVNDYARSLASRGRSVSVLTLSPARRALRQFQPISDDLTQPGQVPHPWPVPGEPARPGTTSRDEPSDQDLPRELGRDDLARTLDQSDHLLVAWLGRPDLAPRDLRTAAVVATVLAGSDEPQLIEAYKNVKLAAAQWPGAQLGVFVTSAPDPRSARRAGDRLTSLVAGFLGRPVRFEGFTTRRTAVTQRFVAERPVDHRHPEDDRRWVTELATFLDRHADRDAAASAWISTPPDPADESLADAPAPPTRTVLPDTRVALPLAEPLTDVGQLDACLRAHLPLWRGDAVSFDRLEHDGPPGVALRRLTHPDGDSTIVAVALDPQLPALETALYAASAVPDIAGLMLVTPPTERCRTIPLLSCALHTLHFSQVRIDDTYGLLLNPSPGPCRQT